jgi:phage-related protein
MARWTRVPGEKPLFWVGSAKGDLLEFPEAVQDDIGVALSVAQFGGKHIKAKPWKGEGPGVLEIVEDHRGDTYRAVYTVKFDQGRLCSSCFPEEIAERDKNSPNGRGIGFPKAQVGERRL